MFGQDKRVILIEVQASMAGLKRGFEASANTIKQKMIDLRSRINEVAAVEGKTFRGHGGMFQSKKATLKNLRSEYQDLSLDLRQMTLDHKKSIAPIQAHADKLKKQIDIAKAGKREFQGWALSLMFFGMALTRAFNTIWKSGTKTFQDVMHSVEGTTTGFDMLEGSIKYLGFTAGAALEPIVSLLIPIIDSVADWVQNNERLFRGIVIGLGVGGTVLTALGMGVLAFEGFLQAGQKMTPILSSLGSFAITPVGAGVLAFLAALAVVGGISWKAFQKTSDAWSSIKKSFSELSPFVDSIKDSFVKLVNNIFPNLEVSWDTIAWFMAMGFNNLIQLIKILLEGFNNLLRMMDMIITHAKGMASTLKLFFEGDFSGAFKTAKNTLKNDISSMEDMVTNFSETAKNSLDNIYFDVNAFKSLYSTEGKKAMEDFNTNSVVQRAFPISNLMTSPDTVSVDKNPNGVYNQYIIERIDMGSLVDSMTATELLEYVASRVNV